MVYIFYVLLLLPNFIYANYTCPIEICGNYKKYSDCWFYRLNFFNLCTIYLNKNKDNLIKQCTNINEKLYNIQSNYTVDLSIYNCDNKFIKINKLSDYLDIGNCFYKMRENLTMDGHDIKNRYINCLKIPTDYNPKCKKNICNKYKEYSTCWELKVTEFDYCIMSINKKNKYVDNCADLYGYDRIDKYNKKLYDNSNPDWFKSCSNETIKTIDNIKNYKPFVEVANCFDNVKNKINIYKILDNKNISCFDIDK